MRFKDIDGYKAVYGVMKHPDGYYPVSAEMRHFTFCGPNDSGIYESGERYMVYICKGNTKQQLVISSDDAYKATELFLNVVFGYKGREAVYARVGTVLLRENKNPFFIQNMLEELPLTEIDPERPFTCFKCKKHFAGKDIRDEHSKAGEILLLCSDCAKDKRGE